MAVRVPLFNPTEVRYICVKGWFQETLPKSSIGKIALLHVDADLYESVKLVLGRFYHDVQLGGYVVIDDYGSWEGCRKAVDEFLASINPAVPLRRVDEDAVYFQKPVLPRVKNERGYKGHTLQPFPAKAYAIENKRLIPYGFRKHKVNRINNICILCY